MDADERVVHEELDSVGVDGKREATHAGDGRGEGSDLRRQTVEGVRGG